MSSAELAQLAWQSSSLLAILFQEGGNGLLCKRCEPKGMASFASRIVQRLRVRRNPLIPDQDSTGFISHSALEVCSFRNMVKEKGEQAIGLFFFETTDPLGVDGVHVW
jgi:hypothetical protein